MTPVHRFLDPGAHVVIGDVLQRDVDEGRGLFGDKSDGLSRWPRISEAVRKCKVGLQGEAQGRR